MRNRVILGAGLLLVPLAWSFGNENTVLVKSLLTGVAAALLLASSGPGRLWSALRPAWPAHLIVIVTLVLTILSPSPSFSRPVALLVITLWLIVAAAAATRAPARWWIAALCITAVPPVLIGWLQAAGLDPSPWQPITLEHFHARICSTLGNPNFFAAWTCGLLPFAVAALLLARGPVAAALSLSLASAVFAALLLTGSKGGLVGLAAALGAATLVVRRGGFDLRSALRPLGAAAWIIPAAALLLTAVMMPGDVRDRLLFRSSEPAPSPAGQPESAPGRLARNESVKFRLLTWAQSGRMLRAVPVFGLGPGRYQVAYPKYRDPEIIRMFGQHSYMTDHPENLTLEIGAELGVAGLGLWVWLWWLVFARLWRRLRTGTSDERLLAGAAFAGLAGLLGTNSVGVDVHYGATAYLGAVFTGLAFRTGNEIPHANSDSPASPYRLFSVLCSVVLMLFWSNLYLSDAALARALASSNGSSWDQAHRWYDEALVLNRGNVMARYFGASALLDSRGPEALPRAEALLDSVRAEAPDYVLLNYKYWLLYNRAGRGADARDALARQIALDPHAATFHLERGRFAMEEKRWEDAERDFEAAAVAEPDNPAGYQYLGNLRVMRGRYRDALAAYDLGLMRHPDSTELHYNAAVAAFKLHDRALARRHAEAVLRIDPSHAQARLVLSKIR